ncbi:YitT family protein [Paenibacillus odorifer]|uniref:YitT family protein n=1 Tax=Paenibacillus odorifer TaxID=189426 RepID=UPI0020BDFCF3|nr:YitT family protein [Paenibacillus odorifer]
MQNKINQRQQLQRSSTFRVLTVIAGALLAAVGLELFLMPHGLVVGGITGLSALFAHTTEMQLGLFLFLFNLPFIFMSRKQVNLRFALYTVLGLTCLTIASLALHRFPAVFSDPLPAAMAGGICLGVGIGISVRFGGVNKQASDQGYSLLSGGPPKSTEVVIMILNCAILLFAGTLFGWEQAMYSIIAYLLAFEGVRISLRGLSHSRTAWITSSRCLDIQQAIASSLNREAAIAEGSGQDGEVSTLFCLTNRMEEEHLRALVLQCDSESQIVFRSATKDHRQTRLHE